jgi:hypothetical protein
MTSGIFDDQRTRNHFLGRLASAAALHPGLNADFYYLGISANPSSPAAPPMNLVTPRHTLFSGRSA